jgi:hypothetical protein
MDVKRNITLLEHERFRLRGVRSVPVRNVPGGRLLSPISSTFGLDTVYLLAPSPA